MVSRRFWRRAMARGSFCKARGGGHRVRHINIIFYPQWNGFESWYQAGGGEEGSAFSWLPVAAAQRFLAENIHGLKYVGDIPSPNKGIFLSRYSGDKEDVIAAWTFDFPYTLTIKAEVRSVIGYTGNSLLTSKRELGWNGSAFRRTDLRPHREGSTGLTCSTNRSATTSLMMPVARRRRLHPRKKATRHRPRTMATGNCGKIRRS